MVHHRIKRYWQKGVWYGLILAFFGGCPSALICQDTVSVYFDYNAFQLTNATQETLTNLVAEHEADQVQELVLKGHCDRRGTTAHNDRLSAQRVAEVAAFLTKQGWTVTKSMSLGETDPRYPAAQAVRNRRVDVFITWKPKLVVAVPPPTPPEPPKDTVTPVDEKPPEDIQLPFSREMEKLGKGEIEVGQRINLKHLNFYPGTANLLPVSEPYLKKLLTVMQENPSLEIMVEGHVCCNPDMELSVARARMVRDYLQEHGIKKKRMPITGFGNTRPLAMEITEADRIKNRRVEIRVLKK